jgi:hypothetical protein
VLARIMHDGVSDRVDCDCCSWDFRLTGGPLRPNADFFRLRRDCFSDSGALWAHVSRYRTEGKPKKFCPPSHVGAALSVSTAEANNLWYGYLEAMWIQTPRLVSRMRAPILKSLSLKVPT